MKSQLRLVIFILLLVFGGRASALDAFQCLTDLMPLTERANHKAKRAHGIEAPFAPSAHQIVFAEVEKSRLKGIYVYYADKAVYYDSANDKNLADVTASDKRLTLVAQPDGLETMTILVEKGKITAASSSTQVTELLHLSTAHTKADDALWAPLYAELDLRKKWVKDHNLDEATFKGLQLAMEASCKNL